MIKWISRTVTAMAVVAASLVAVAQPASAAYPTNLPPGYTSVPFAMDTLTWSQAGTFSNGTPELRCYVGVVLTFDGDRYGDAWRPTRQDIRGPFRVQGPTGTPPVLNEAASVNDADAYDVITADLYAEPFRTWFASYSNNVPGHGIPVRGAGGMAQLEDGCSAYQAQMAEVVAHPELYAVWTPKFLPRHDPVADFEYQVTDVGTNTVAFTNLSNDAEDGSNLTSAWNFGGGATSTSPNPTHSFSEGGHPLGLAHGDRQPRRQEHGGQGRRAHDRARGQLDWRRERG